MRHQHLQYDPDQPPDAARWLETDEAERVELCVDAHAGLGPHDPEQENARVHAAFHNIVETQVARDEPPETAQTLARLQREGLSRHDAIHAVASVLAGYVFEAIRQERPLDTVKYVHDLRHLDAETFRRGTAH